MKPAFLVLTSACVPALVVSFVAGSTLVSCKEGPPKLEGPALSITPVASEPPIATPPMKPNTTVGDQDKDTFPMSDEAIQAIVNKSKATEYTGPTGAVEGTIFVKGDPPIDREFVKLPAGCEDAPKIHAPIYRAGAKHELADTLVAAIGYAGFVRPSRQDKVVTIKNCSIEPTVIDLSLGQRLMVGNDDKMPYMPQLPGKAPPVRRLSLQGQSPVPMFLTYPGAYGMTWLAGALPGSDVPSVLVFVLPNAIHTVTQLDGKFRLTGIPVGKVRITASHFGMDEAFKDLEVKADAETKLELTLTYKRPAEAAPSTLPSIKPAPSQKPLH